MAYSAQHILVYLTLHKFIITAVMTGIKSFIHYNSSPVKLQVDFHQNCSEHVQARASSTYLAQDKVNYRYFFFF